MNPTPNHVQPHAPFTSNSNQYNHCVSSNAEKFKACEPLLHKIILSFGFYDNESRYLIDQVYACAHSNYGCEENNQSVRIGLVKMVVHQCIYKISSRLFSQVNSNMEKKIDKDLTHSFAYNNTNTFKLQQMPLSIRAVFILKNNLGFSENEIAIILNISTHKVKERFNKAIAYRNGCR
jgi:hypothetical protein